ncbi:MAG: Uma2 family endonuclease [Acidobacteria bacterium]|nr:Uma2 family endonuclease [Acidobacteriota bacterium]
MSQAFSYQPAEEPDVAHLITEDDEPVDNLFSEKQQRLLTEPLFTSWPGPGEDRKFLACANVAVFNIARNPPVVPDMLLSFDVEVHPDIWAKEHRSYMVWELGKPPDLVVEIVSNKVGGEQSEKKIKYALMRVMYYVVFDPERLLSDEVVTIYHLGGLSYRRFDGMRLPDYQLGFTLWEGEFEGFHHTWLRWTDEHGNLILTGKEQAVHERAEKERERAEKEAALAQVEQLAEQLRALGHEPQQR